MKFRMMTLLQVSKVTDLIERLRRLRSYTEGTYMDCIEDAICEIESLIAEIKANNKTYRMAQDRANNDIETLTADIDEYQQRQDEIIVALGSQGILPSEIVGKVRSLLAEGRRWKELCESMLIHVEPGAGQRRADSYEDEYNDLVATQ